MTSQQHHVDVPNKRERSSFIAQAENNLCVKSAPVYWIKWLWIILFHWFSSIFQDRLDSMRQALSDSKRQNHNLTETVHLLQDQLSEVEQQCRNMEEQIEHLQKVRSDGTGGCCKNKCSCGCSSLVSTSNLDRPPARTWGRMCCHLVKANCFSSNLLKSDHMLWF